MINTGWVRDVDVYTTLSTTDLPLPQDLWDLWLIVGCEKSVGGLFFDLA